MLIPDARNKFQYVSPNGNQSFLFRLDNVAQCIEFDAQHGQSSRVSRHPIFLFRSRALCFGSDRVEGDSTDSGDGNATNCTWYVVRST